MRFDPLTVDERGKPSVFASFTVNPVKCLSFNDLDTPQILHLCDMPAFCRQSKKNLQKGLASPTKTWDIENGQAALPAAPKL
ncbi:MAG: hypothetical protein ABSG59_05990 [Verrucomicrobiota bacterium]